MAHPETAVVVGGGILGLATAYALGREGVCVTVIDKATGTERATDATAGIIGGSSVIPWASSALWPRLPALLRASDGPLRIARPLPERLLRFFGDSVKAGRKAPRQASAAGLANLGLRGWDAWQDLLSPLPEARDLFVQRGCLFYYATPEQQAADAQGNALRRSFGMGLVDLERADMLAALPPLHQPVHAGVRVSAAGHVIDPLHLQSCLRGAITAQGGSVVNAHVTGFERSETTLRGVLVEGDTPYRGDRVILAAGSGAANLAIRLGRRVPMVPAWGASVTFTAPSIDLETPFLMLSDGIAVTPSRAGLRVSGLLQLGGAGRADAMITSLITKAKQLFGDFTHGDILTVTGPRPLSADSLPFLGPDPQYRNLLHCYGHGHWGLTQAAISALVNTDLALGRAPRVDISAYRPDRF